MLLCRTAFGIVLALFSVAPVPGEPQPDRDKKIEGLWQAIKRSLTSEAGQQYFQDNIRGSVLPPLRGVVVSASPATNPTAIVLALSDRITAEVTLDLIERVPRKRNERRPAAFQGRLEPGAMVEFSGIGVSFQRSPFMLTFDAPVTELKVVPGAPGK